MCEKSDGVRVLVFVVMNGMSGSQEVWLVSLGEHTASRVCPGRVSALTVWKAREGGVVEFSLLTLES